MAVAVSSALLLIPILVVWGLYSAFRTARYTGRRWRALGEFAVFVVFFVGVVLLLLVFRPT